MARAVHIRRSMWLLDRASLVHVSLFTLFTTSLSVACGKDSSPAANSEHPDERGASVGERPPNALVKLTFGAYSTPREVYGKDIIPQFVGLWSQTHDGQRLKVEESYQASGAQARAILGGFEADITALSLEPDLAQLEAAGLVTHDFRAAPHGGIVTTSLVVIGVREGNPKGIADWADLAKPGVEVLTPNVKTSGGAMWNILAIHGAATRGKTGELDSANALSAILANVRIMDASARESMLNFERGVGDAIITYENEIIEGQRQGKKYEIVVPRSTISIENPIAVVDKNAASHGVVEVAREFLDFVWSEQSQRAFANHGYRPVDPVVKQESSSRFPPVADVFTVRDLGGWVNVKSSLFGDGGVYDQALKASREKRQR